MKHDKHKQGGALQKNQKRQKQDKVLTYFHCRKPRNFKKDCTKYHAWIEKKGNLITLIFIEVNLSSVPTDTWWLDYVATIHFVCQCKVDSIVGSEEVRRNMYSLQLE